MIGINPNDINPKCGRICFSVEDFEGRIRAEQARAIAIFTIACRDNKLNLPEDVCTETVAKIMGKD